MTTSSNLGQRVLSPDEQDTGNRSINPDRPAYDGTWNRLWILGKGNFGIVYCEQHTETGKMRAVKEIRSGQRDSISREIQCMIRLKAVSASILHCPSVLLSFHPCLFPSILSSPVLHKHEKFLIERPVLLPHSWIPGDMGRELHNLHRNGLPSMG